LLSTTAFPAHAASSPEEKAELLHRKGIRRELNISERSDLAPMRAEADARAARLNLGCEVQEMLEVRLVFSEMEMIAGYEAYVACDDAPSPGISFYYDVDRAYLSAVSAI
jgi:hypothetical protein